jgi:hypothetical protein
VSLAGCVSALSVCPAPSTTLYFAPNTVEITGVLHQNQYLSVMEGSRKEMINEAYVLELDQPVTITTDPNGTAKKFKTLHKVERVEVLDLYDFSFWDYLGKRLTLTGSLSLITEMPGFHRQMPAPVEIKVSRVTVLAE